MKMLVIIITLINICVNADTSTWSSCKLIKEPIERLECEITESRRGNAKLKKKFESSLTRKKTTMEQSKDSDVIQNKLLLKLSKKYNGLSTQCTRKICGPCTCFTDYQVNTRQYCNCEHLKPMRDCLAFKKAGYNISGLYRIHLNNGKKVEVFCDQKTDNGGWTIIQRRMNGEENFYRDWKAYKQGFGNPHREHWLGNDNIYLLTLQAEYPKGSEIRFDMQDWDHKAVFAKYNKFSIENEDQKYRLHVQGYQGNAGDSFSDHNGAKFTTYDEDNDGWSKNCAVSFLGAWWYKACHSSNLNGVYRKAGESVINVKGVSWYRYKNKNQHYSMMFTEMKVRRKE